MIICGQTQRSGKTTTLDALVERSGRQAIAFVTKRGEGALSGGTTVAPYFRERADWQFVESVLESAMKQKMRFERAWIIRAAAGAESLADVQKNVVKLAAKAKGGMNADMYMLLGEYLKLVVPLIAKLPTASKVMLSPGLLSVMDLVAYPAQMQALVIRSTIEWVHEYEEKTIVLVPEAWKFMPRDRGAPVKLAAAAMAREGAALGNLLWVDSQDIVGADYEVLRQASVWLLGVQREANEIKRALAHLPAGIKKPKPDEVANLKVGQFWACAPGSARLVYVQPKWLNEHEARMVATGKMTPEHAARAKEPIPALRDRRFPPLTPEDEARAITIDIKQEDDMTPAQEKKLDDLIDTVGALAKALGKLPAMVKVTTTTKAAPAPVAEPGDEPEGTPTHPSLDHDSLYQYVLGRLKREAPALIKTLSLETELEVTVERVVIQLDGTTLRGRISKLFTDGFFKAAKDGSAVLAELARRGGGAGDRANYSRELAWLTERGCLTKEGTGWLAAPGVKVKVVER